MKLKNELKILQLYNERADYKCLIDSAKTLYFDRHKRLKEKFNRLHEHKCRHSSESDIEVESARHTAAPARVPSKDFNIGLHACRNYEISGAHEE